MKHPVKHPAKFREDHLRWVADHVDLEGARILDPFAGVGTVHRLHELCDKVETWGVEIEPEWAEAPVIGPYSFSICDDSTNPDLFEKGSFDVVVTSPVFGNRMSDHHHASDVSRRNTYTHTLGRPLHPNNAGRMFFWGSDYRRLHVKVWRNCARWLSDGGEFVLNVKNFTRAGETVDVVNWHRRVLEKVGFTEMVVEWIDAPGLRHGENWETREATEAMILFWKD